jgi:hypothetical protein
MDEDLRRPVEVFGLLHIAAQAGAAELDDPGDADLFQTVRPDGSKRSFVTTRTIFAPDQLDAIEVEDPGGRS